MKNYLIVGNGIAAAGCVEGIRSVDPDGAITVVSEEKHHVYSRPLISYYLEGKTDLDRMKYRDDSFYEENGCRVIFGVRAIAADPVLKQVTLEDGTALPYDELCVAAGSRPFVPPFEGLEEIKNRFSFMTLDDALALEAAVKKDSRVLIVGAGLIGLKCAEGLRDRAGSIVVCDLADRILSSILDPDCATVVQKHLENNGIEFMIGDTAVKFTADYLGGGGGSALMKSGRTVDFDVLVLAVGVRANSGLVKDMGGAVNRGAIVNTRMETTVPSVYAAGDCAEGYDSSLGANRVLAILPNAYMQGHTAGVNMAGGSKELANSFPINSVGFFGLHIMTAGAYDGEMTEESRDRAVRRFFVKDGLLRGFILIGSTERAGIYTSLIREKTPLASVDFGLIKNSASNLAFSRDERRKKFGGVV